MMNNKNQPYLVLARKWRPQLFEEVVGQDHIVRTLRNAISLGRVAHAYLFAGPRGTGKTSTARILAKAMNCERGPTPSPCNQCSNCREIIRGESLDVLEIDGASNRGIEEIRNLRERARFFPVKARFKVYIIDEVHMLTHPAFNALLKTLEEPPPHVIFIFATTDPHKLPSTIISRCQRFDFKRISTVDILSRLKQIVKGEKVSITSEALALIAEGADNSMRDGEVMLDQAISYAGGDIGETDVANILGIVEKRYLLQLTENVVKEDASASINLINELLERGKSPEWLIKGWQKWFRDLVMIKLKRKEDDFSLLALEEQEGMRRQASCFSLRDLLHFINVLSQARRRIYLSPQPQIHLELLAVELSSPDFEVDRLGLKDPELAGIYQKIVDLEKRLINQHSPYEKKIVEKALKAEQKEEEEIVPQTEKNREEKDNRFFEKWPLILREIEGRKKSLGALLHKAKIISTEKNSATLGLGTKFSEETLKKKENSQLIKEVLQEFLSPNFILHYTLVDSPSKPGFHKMILKAAEIFDGEIIR